MGTISKFQILSKENIIELSEAQTFSRSIIFKGCTILVRTTSPGYVPRMQWPNPELMSQVLWGVIKN
jgi:hypothetical protein